MDRLGKRTLLLVAAASFAMALSGIFNGVNAQSNITCCLTKNGKLKNCEFGENPRKECRKKQTLITLPLADTLGDLIALASSKTFFVTSQIFDGDLQSAAHDLFGCSSGLSGLDAADCICQRIADKAPTKVPAGKYKAWLSDDTSSPHTRWFHSPGPYVNVNGGIIADSYTKLVAPPLRIAPSIDENGNEVDESVQVWTGTTAFGLPGVSPFCTDWIDNVANNDHAEAGDPHRTDNSWTEVDEADCRTGNRLYCAEQ